MTASLLNNLSAAASFGALFGAACAVIGYKAGHYFGWSKGWLSGRNEEASHTNAKIIRAKMIGSQAAIRAGERFSVNTGGNDMPNRAARFPSVRNNSDPNGGSQSAETHMITQSGLSPAKIGD